LPPLKTLITPQESVKIISILTFRFKNKILMTSSVIIDSIGTAKPIASKILSDAFEIPQELITKLIYGAPSVLLHKVDEKIANKATKTLSQLGLEVRVQDASIPVPTDTTTYDISIYIEDIALLPLITKQVSEFLGCGLKEAFHLLTQESGIVIGGVSKATVDAFSKRIDAKVVASQASKDTYTISVDTTDKSLLKQLCSELKTMPPFINIPYKTSQNLWRKYGSNSHLSILNESHQRFEIVLENVVATHPEYRKTLLEKVGMPEAIIDTVLQNLPVQLEEGLPIQEAIQVIEDYKENGLACSIKPLPTADCSIEIEITDLESTQSLLSQFVSKDQLPVVEGQKWTSPPLKRLIVRYVEEKLNNIETTSEIVA